jgi:hypothetical protein
LFMDQDDTPMTLGKCLILQCYDPC